jgi:hypothetical protein
MTTVGTMRSCVFGILLLVSELVKRQIFSSFEFEVLYGFFEFGHGLGPVSDGQS